MKKAVVIVAGGKGLRMGGDVPKQFLPVGGKPVLMRTISRFLEYDKAMQVVLVLPVSQQEYWRQLCAEYHFSEPHIVADGGETRFHSVKNGLSVVAPDVTLVGVLAADMSLHEARRSGAVVPVIPVVETVRHLTDDGGSETVSRDDYRLVQTPQVFDAALLRHAYTQEYTSFFTDDASVVEALGHAVTLVDGNRENIKITTPSDLAIAEVCCRG